jgi:hypothetical protein
LRVLGIYTTSAENRKTRWKELISEQYTVVIFEGVVKSVSAILSIDCGSFRYHKILGLIIRLERCQAIAAGGPTSLPPKILV